MKEKSVPLEIISASAAVVQERRFFLDKYCLNSPKNAEIPETIPVFISIITEKTALKISRDASGKSPEWYRLVRAELPRFINNRAKDKRSPIVIDKIERMQKIKRIGGQNAPKIKRDADIKGQICRMRLSNKNSREVRGRGFLTLPFFVGIYFFIKREF